MVVVDLHLHTTLSDGTLRPSQVVDLCAERGLRIIAISDHDSTEGLAEAFETAKRYPELTIVPAIELSTDIPGSEIHVLGYFVDYTDPSFQQVLKGFREGRVRLVSFGSEGTEPGSTSRASLRSASLSSCNLRSDE